ncbi:MAG: hypothetical protein R3C54_17600 [Parvularculaceae bacterium]
MLKVRFVALDTYPENTAFLSRTCTAYRPEEFQALRKIEIVNGGKTILATLVISDDPSLVASDEIGLGSQAFRRLGAREGETVRITQPPPRPSLDAVRRKINGATMTDAEIAAVIADIAAHRYSPMEIAAFLVSSAAFMTTDEVLALTRAMTDVGEKLSWDMPMVVDKHCIGGIPGNRTSMIVAPIVAAHGLYMPKTSSRAITSPAGTADTMEVLARVDLAMDEMMSVVRKTKSCLIWGGHGICRLRMMFLFRLSARSISTRANKWSLRSSRRRPQRDRPTLCSTFLSGRQRKFAPAWTRRGSRNSSNMLRTEWASRWTL